MPNYRLECSGTCREVYNVEADDEAQARQMFETGALGQPVVTECTTDIDEITEDGR